MIRNAAIASIALLSTCLSSTALADNPQGACCWPDPDLGMVCQLMNVQACNQAGGYFYGNGTSCQDPFVECDAPLGACCVEDGDIGLVCYALTAADCADVAGYFYGAGTLCTDPLVECVPANEDGACCFEDANGWQCVELEAYKCQDLAGTWYGAGVLCSSPQIVCPPEEPIGACCADEDGDGQYWCAQLTLIDCSASNGYWYGPGVLCSDPIVECETQDDPRGACCIFDDAANQYWCSQQTLIDCSASNGYWYGPGVLCSDPMVECESAPVDGCTSEAGAQCAGRPSYMDQAYLDTFSHGGEIAVMTASPAITGGAVLTVFDLADTIGAPTNSWFALDRYSHNTWTQATLGSIFGLAIDSDGAIYVSATRSWWMDVMGPAGWGGVYRIDPITGAVSTFAVLPNVISGLGSMTYDCDHNQFFVSNFENGLLYQLDAAGNTVGTFDHGLPFNGVSPAALGDRPFGVEVHAGRLYYSLWNEDQNTYAAATANEIWSVELDATGTPVLGTALLEISIPQFYNNWSSPVSDIRFSTTGSMMLAERSMNGIDGLGAHNARVLEYECVAGVWTPSVNTFNVGSIPQSAAGGVDVTDAMVWASADAMHIGYQDNMYGIQGLPLSGGTTANSVLIDYQDNLTNQDKTLLGDLVVVPGQNVIVACPQLQDLSINCISVPGPDDYELVLGISNMDALATITSVTLSPPSGMTLSPSVFAMNLPGQHSWSVTTVLSGAANGQDVCFDVTIIFDNGAVCEDVLCVDLPNCNIQVPGDLNADFVVDISDLLMLLEAFGADCAEGCDADLNGDGQVGVDDLLILVSNWS
jgi:hypothetical protein